MPDPGSKARASGDMARSRCLHRGDSPPGFDLKPWLDSGPAPQEPRPDPTAARGTSPVTACSPSDRSDSVLARG